MLIIRSSRLYVCYYCLWCAMLWLLVVGGQAQSTRQCVRDEGCRSSDIPHSERMAGCPPPEFHQPATKASHTIGGNNTHIVSSSWWWAYKCSKHVEHIISAIKHSVASSWFFFCTHPIWYNVPNNRTSIHFFTLKITNWFIGRTRLAKFSLNIFSNF